MSASKIRSDYAGLAAIQTTFERSAANTRQTAQAVRQNMDTLARGDWKGQGATRFYNEMTSAILPSLRRLAQALEEAARLTGQINQLLQQAEQEAAAVFRMEEAGGAAQASGAARAASAGAEAGRATVQRPLSAWAHVTEVPPLQYARFSSLAYSNDPQLPDDLRAQGWEVVGHTGNLLPGQALDGYQGAAFFNPRTGELVIAHRGTDEWNFNPFNRQPSDVDDDAAIALGRVPDQFGASRLFLQQVQAQLQQDPRYDPAQATVVHTGHSLGGALADLNALADGRKGMTFDNPGTLAIVRNNPALFPGDRANLVNYQSNANAVHLGGTPAGYAVQLIPQTGDSQFTRQVQDGAIAATGIAPVVGLAGLASKFQSTLTHHSLDNMIASMSPDTGYPRGYFPPEAGDTDHGWHTLGEGQIPGAVYAPACFAPPTL